MLNPASFLQITGAPEPRDMSGLTIRERVSQWSMPLFGTPITPSRGWNVTSLHTPERDQPVLGFYAQTREAILLRHRSGGVYEPLHPERAWFDDKPALPNEFVDPPNYWMVIPKHLYLDDEMATLKKQQQTQRDQRWATC